MKKILSVIILAALFAGFAFAVPASAASGITITAEVPTSGAAGSTVQILFEVSGSAAAAGIEIEVQLNSDILEYESMSAGAYLERFDGQKSAANGKFVAYSRTEVSSSGILGTVTCTALRSFSESDSLVSISGLIVDMDIEEIDFDFNVQRVVDRTQTEGYKSLQSKIAQAEDLPSSDYTTASYRRLTSAISSARSVLNSASSTDSDYSSAVASIDSAISALVYRLEELVDSASDYTASLYTESTFAALTSAISAARAVLDRSSATASDRAAQVRALNSAINNLVRLTDLEDLRNLVDQASQYREADFSAASFEALTDAIEAANAVLENEDAVNSQVQNALEGLRDALASMEESPLSILTNLVLEARQLKSEDYQAESFEAFMSVLEQAEALLDAGNATEDQLREQAAALRQAMDNLAPVPKKALSLAIEAAGELNLEIYLQSTVEALQQAVEAGQKLLDEGTATDEEYQAAADAILDAIANLVVALQDIYDRAMALLPEDYTESSYANLTNILAAAKEVLDDPYATEEDKLSMAEQILFAIEQLSFSPRGKLKNTLEEALQISSSEYTQESYTALVDAIMRAQELLDNPEATDEEFSEMEADLRQHILALVVSNRVELRELVEEAQALITSDAAQLYSPESYSRFTAALVAAQALLEDDSATEEQMQQAIDELRAAMDGLTDEEPVNYSMLLVCAVVCLATAALMVAIYFIVRFAAKKKKQRKAEPGDGKGRGLSDTL